MGVLGGAGLGASRFLLLPVPPGAVVEGNLSPIAGSLAD